MGSKCFPWVLPLACLILGIHHFVFWRILLVTTNRALAHGIQFVRAFNTYALPILVLAIEQGTGVLGKAFSMQRSYPITETCKAFHYSTFAVVHTVMNGLISFSLAFGMSSLRVKINKWINAWRVVHNQYPSNCLLSLMTK